MADPRHARAAEFLEGFGRTVQETGGSIADALQEAAKPEVGEAEPVQTVPRSDIAYVLNQHLPGYLARGFHRHADTRFTVDASGKYRNSAVYASDDLLLIVSLARNTVAGYYLLRTDHAITLQEAPQIKDQVKQALDDCSHGRILVRKKAVGVELYERFQPGGLDAAIDTVLDNCQRKLDAVKACIPTNNMSQPSAISPEKAIAVFYPV